MLCMPFLCFFPSFGVNFVDDSRWVRGDFDSDKLVEREAVELFGRYGGEAV